MHVDPKCTVPRNRWTINSVSAPHDFESSCCCKRISAAIALSDFRDSLTVTVGMTHDETLALLICIKMSRFFICSRPIGHALLPQSSAYHSGLCPQEMKGRWIYSQPPVSALDPQPEHFISHNPCSCPCLCPCDSFEHCYCPHVNLRPCPSPDPRHSPCLQPWSRPVSVLDPDAVSGRGLIWSSASTSFWANNSAWSLRD